MEPNTNFTSASKPTVGSMTSNLDEVSTGAHKTIEKLSEAARPAVDRIASGAHHAVDKLAGAAETLGSKGEKLIALETRMMEEARAYVRENPVTSLGIAAGIGYLLSRALGSR